MTLCQSACLFMAWVMRSFEMSEVRVLVFSLCTIACATAACGRTGLDQGFDTTNVTAGTAGSGIGNGESGSAGNGGDTFGQGGVAGKSARPPTAVAIPCGDSACAPGAQICCLQRGRRQDTATCIDANAEALARYAALCQEGDLVPIVEPEVLMDGTHTIERYFEVTQQTLESVFHAMYEHRIVLEGMLLKPNMVLSGKDCPQQASVQEVAKATVSCLKRVVPAAVPGIVFLSGGQTDQQATEHLNAMNQLPGLPWQLSFSYGRALQAPVLKAWKGEQANVAKAQEAFHHRAWCNSKARFGKYTEDMETAKAA